MEEEERLLRNNLAALVVSCKHSRLIPGQSGPKAMGSVDFTGWLTISFVHLNQDSRYGSFFHQFARVYAFHMSLFFAVQEVLDLI